MGLFKKRPVISTTSEERQGDWTRQQLLQHWRTIPDGQKIVALMHATDDQLRVMAWHLPDPQDRLVAISEASQRRKHPEIRRKIVEGVDEELSTEDFRTWAAPIQRMHGSSATRADVDHRYEEVFGTVR